MNRWRALYVLLLGGLPGLALAQRYDQQDQPSAGLAGTFGGMCFMVTAWAVFAENGWWRPVTEGKPGLRLLLLFGPPLALAWLLA